MQVVTRNTLAAKPIRGIIENPKWGHQTWLHNGLKIRNWVSCGYPPPQKKTPPEIPRLQNLSMVSSKVQNKDIILSTKHGYKLVSRYRIGPAADQKKVKKK